MNCERCQTDMTVNSSTGGHYCPVCADAENTLADSAIPTTLAPQNPATPALEHSSTVIVPEEDIKRSSVLKNGSMLGSYKIVGRIGRGGMGCVYKAEQQSPRRLVALKVLLHGQSSKEADRLRFKREAAVVALLDHPNIVPIIESGETECGELYYTMPLVEGVPLDTYVSEHKLPLRDILRLFSRVCAGVHAAHQRGAIHRDLKPGNILVNQAGRPQVLDFGLAKLVTEPEGSEATVMEGSAISEASIEVSRADEFLGTPAYMAPEQGTRRPQDMDTRTDVYSLGVILYRLLTGVYPYQFTGTIRQIITTIREAPPIPPSTFNGAIPSDLSAVLLKALAKKKEHRFQSVAEFASDIDAFLADRPVSSHTTTTIYRTRKFVQRNAGASVLGSIATVAILCIIAAAFFNIAAARDYAEARRQAAEEAKLEAQAANIEADRRYAESLVAQGDSSLLLGRFADAKDSYHRAHSVKHALPRTHLRANLGLWQANRVAPPALSSNAGHQSLVLALAFSADKRILLSSDWDGRILVWDGLTNRPLHSLHGHDAPVLALAVSADAKSALSGDSNGVIILWNLAKGTPQQVLRGHRAYISRLAFLSDRIAISASDDGDLRFWNLKTGAPGVRISSSEGLAALAASPTGDVIVAGSKNGEVIALTPDGGERWRRAGLHPYGVVDLLVVDDTYLVTCGGAEQVRLLKLADGSDAAQVSIEDAKFVALGKRNDTLLLGTRKRIRQAQLPDLAIIDDFGIEASEEESIGFSADGQILYVTRPRGFDLFTSEPMRGLRTLQLPQRASAFALSDDLRLIATAMRGQVEVFDRITGHRLRRIPIDQRVNDLQFITPTKLACGGSLEFELASGKMRPGNIVEILDLISGNSERLPYPATPEGERRQSIKSIALSPDAKWLATASTDGSVRLWQVDKANALGPALTHAGGSSINQVLFAPDGHLIAGTQTGDLLRWSIDAPDQPESLSEALDLELEVIWRLAWAPEHRFLAIASGGGSITVLDAEFASVEHRFSASGSVSALAFLGETYLTTGGRDGSARVWEWREGRSIRDFQLHDNTLDSLAVAEGWLLTAGWDKRLQILHLPQPERLASLLESVHDAGTRLRTDSDDGVALKVLGWWQMEHGVWAAAADLFARAETRGAAVPALVRARVHWQAGDLEEAQAWLQRAHQAGEIPTWYYNICSDGVRSFDQEGL